MSRDLAGRRVIVTRAAERAGALSDLLREAGADVVEIPVTTTTDAADGGLAIRDAVARLDDFDWVVVTSPEGARRLAAELVRVGRSREDLSVCVAAVGRATAELVGGADLVPDTQTGASLGEVFPAGGGRVLLAVAESAGTDFEESAREKGWVVERVHTYRTIPVRPDESGRAEITKCDAITFTAASSVDAWVAVFGTLTPPSVIAMGPRTAEALRRAGIDRFTVAGEQSLDGIVAAVRSAIG